MAVGLLALSGRNGSQLGIKVEAVRVGCAKVALSLLLGSGLLRLLLLLAKEVSEEVEGGLRTGRIPSS
jgi:hypothetical protein